MLNIYQEKTLHLGLSLWACHLCTFHPAHMEMPDSRKKVGAQHKPHCLNNPGTATISIRMEPFQNPSSQAPARAASASRLLQGQLSQACRSSPFCTEQSLRPSSLFPFFIRPPSLPLLNLKVLAEMSENLDALH